MSAVQRRQLAEQQARDGSAEPVRYLGGSSTLRGARFILTAKPPVDGLGSGQVNRTILALSLSVGNVMLIDFDTEAAAVGQRPGRSRRLTPLSPRRALAVAREAAAIVVG